MKNLFYFGLEPLKQRYTYQLSTQWMPNTFKKYVDKNIINFVSVPGNFDESEEIKIGSVLDGIGRGIYSMSQCQNFLQMLSNGNVKDGDILYFQDMWTPGVEAIFYALDLYNYKDVKFYTRCWAQSVDEYDFTFDMRNWMRLYELGFDKRLSGIFVGSTIHREQLRNAGFNAPIHVCSLPVNTKEVHALIESSDINNTSIKQKRVLFTSRFDKEKNPYFMLEVAEKFLEQNPDYEWYICSSAPKLRSTIPGLIDDMYALEKKNSRFKIMKDLSKSDYYHLLKTSQILFNSSLQDYVSFTIIEGSIFGIDVCFPNFRSFQEFVPEDRMYRPFYVESALEKLNNIIKSLRQHNYIAERTDLGRKIECNIVVNGSNNEVNIWHEDAYIKNILKTK